MLIALRSLGTLQANSKRRSKSLPFFSPENVQKATKHEMNRIPKFQNLFATSLFKKMYSLRKLFAVHIFLKSIRFSCIRCCFF